jgi:2-polyprenyl-3-methyl-5-hydroxy-6-metoxy-1,4-benzoquinol methylase
MRHLRELPRSLWRTPIQQQQQQHHAQQLAAQQAILGLHSMQLQSLEARLLALQNDFGNWSSGPLPFAFHQPDAPWLPLAEARLGKSSRALLPAERAEAFYSYFSEMAGDTFPILHQQYQAYLPLLQQARQSMAAHPDLPWLDIGCGAGEFLQFLSDQGWSAEGVDLNAAEVARCQAKGLSVHHADAIAYLQQPAAARADQRYAGISLLQVIEHLPPGQVLSLLQACVQRLAPGGLLLVETVNLRHPLALNGFYTDPTHKNPLADNYLAFVLQWLALESVGVLYTLPMPVTLMARAEQTAHYMNYTVYGQAGPAAT